MTEEKEKRVGRPTNKALESNTPGKRVAKKPGPKPGDAAILNEYKAMMLTSPKSPLILKKILDAALDDDHKHQQIAWKIVTDRLVPVAVFDNGANRGHSGVNITINTVKAEDVSIEEEEPVEAEFEEIV